MEKLKKVRIPDQSFANQQHTSMLFSILTEKHGNFNSMSHLSWQM